MWMMVWGAYIGSATYLISTFLTASLSGLSLLIIDIGTGHVNVSDSLQALPTFAQLITTQSSLILC